MARQVIFLGTNPNDGTGESLRGGGGMINDNFEELYALQSDTINAGALAYSAATSEARIQLAIDDAVLLGKSRVFVPSQYLPYDASLVTFNASVQMVREGGDFTVYDVQAYGVVGDGVTDETVAIQAAETARPAHGTLWFPPGHTYIVDSAFTGAGASAATLLKVLQPGVWDLNGSVLKYGSANDMVVGTEGGGLGMVNVLAAPWSLLGYGSLDGNNLVRSPLAFQDDLSGFTIFVEIKNIRETNQVVWDGTQCTVSVDVNGRALGAGRAKNISGILRRPNCPMMSTLTTISNHVDVTALLLGGSTVLNNHTSHPIVISDAQEPAIVCLCGTVGVPQFVFNEVANVAHADLSVCDLNNNSLETQGFGITNWGSIGTGINLGHAIKNGVASAWYHYNVTSGSGTPPNVRIRGKNAGGTSAQHGEIHLCGRFASGSVTPTDGANVAIDLSLGNRFYCALTASRAISAPTNVPTNLAGTQVTQRISITIKNISAGAITTTFNAAYHLAGAWVDPAAAKQRSIDFEYDVAAGVCYEVNRTAADVTP